MLIKLKRSRLIDIENKLVVTSGKRKRSKVNSSTVDKKEVTMGLYEIMCVKLLKIVRHYRILKFACSSGHASLIPGSGRSPGKANSNPLQGFCLGNPMDSGT